MNRRYKSVDLRRTYVEYMKEMRMNIVYILYLHLYDHRERRADCATHYTPTHVFVFILVNCLHAFETN